MAMKPPLSRLAALFCAAVLLAMPLAALAEESTAAAPASEQAISREAIARSPFSFELPSRHGNEDKVEFADLVLDTNAVIFLWTTDCPLCKLEVRHMNRLAAWVKEHPEANLCVYSVNFDPLGERGFEKAKWDEVMLPQFSVFYDPGARHFKEEAWKVEENGLPLTFFFARGGFPVRIIKGFSADLLTVAQKEFLPKKAPAKSEGAK
jgi:thiol-disulfide isomerase/thioredoxin